MLSISNGSRSLVKHVMAINISKSIQKVFEIFGVLISDVEVCPHQKFVSRRPTSLLGTVSAVPLCHTAKNELT
jgi:hypothetical protein